MAMIDFIHVDDDGHKYMHARDGMGIYVWVKEDIG